MTHEVFISYSHHDKAIADGVCANLEQAGIRCWIAPRDIAPGYDWPTAISDAIDHSRVLVLIFSSRSNSSKDVGRELILAANNNCIIVPFKIEDVAPEPGKKYYLARTHWLDAMDPPTQEQIDKLVSCVHAFLVDAGVELAVKPPKKQAHVPAVIQPPPADVAKEFQPSPIIKQEDELFEKESLPAPPSASPPTRTSPGSGAILPVKKPRNGIRFGLGIGIAGFILLLGVILIWQDVLDVPAISYIFSHPTSTSTFTKTPIPTSSPTLTSTHFPTRMPEPAWVSEFSAPILAAISKSDSAFEAQQIVDYRDWLEADCTPPNIDMADNSYAMFAQNCRFSWKSWFPDFVIKMIVRLEPVTSPYMDNHWTFYYRSQDGFSFYTDGRMQPAFSSDDFFASNALQPGSIENTITIIVKNQEHALIVNGEPIYYGPLPSGYKNGIGSWIVDDPVTFTYLEIWEINSIP